MTGAVGIRPPAPATPNLGADALNIAPGARINLGTHLVTDERVPFDRLRDVVSAAVMAGFGVVQVRAKTISAREMIAQCAALADVIDGRAALLVNDRLDVALAARDLGVRIDGVHLGQDDVPPVTARRLLGASALIGWTANTAAHRADSEAMPAGTIDYFGVGAVHATSTKPDHPPVLGVSGFAAFAASTPVPCIAIGGLSADDVSALGAAGATGVAVVSAVCGAADPYVAAREFTTAVASWA